MKSSKLYLLACAMSVTAVLGCRDATEPSTPRPGLEPKSTATARGRVRDLYAVDQFALSLNAAGTLKPGQPIQLRATARALLASRDARVQIVVPEAASMRLARRLGHPGRAPVGVPLPAEARTQRMMPQGALVHQQAQVVFDQPGYYRVMVIAEDVSGDEPVVNGEVVRNQAAKELWLLVTTTGGKVTRDFDAALIPSGVPQQSGPFGRVVTQATCGDACPPPCTGCDCGGCANNYVIFEAITHFTDSRTGSLVNRPLEMAQISVKTPSSTINGVMDSQGRFRINSCPAYPSTWEVRIFNLNADVAVYPRGTSGISHAQAVYANINSSYCGKVVQYQSGLPESYVFVNMAFAAARGRTFFQRSRSRVPVYLVHSVQDGDLANYTAWYDDIEMYMDDYLGSRGIFVAGHEYGHAFHEKALGGIDGGCDGNHSFYSESSFGCAFSEGFANYYAAVTLGDSTGSYYTKIQSPNAFVQGAASEQAVAATYFDITDPVGTGDEAAWDVIQYPGSYIAQLIQSCEEFSSGFGATGATIAWFRARGVDAIIYCMERYIDPNMRSAHFVEGNYRFIYDFREGATEPGGATQASDIRRLWLHNLYMQ